MRVARHSAGRPRWLLPAAMALCFVASLLPAAHPDPRYLSFQERLRAQEAIERVYYRHLIGAKRPFEEAVTRELLEKKVRTYLKQSVALEELWKTPVAALALQKELERIAASTRFPERLEEIYAALGHDPFLVQECLARPVLVDRLTRSFFAWDERIHAAPRRQAEEMRRRLVAGSLQPDPDDPGWQILDLAQAGASASSTHPHARASSGQAGSPRRRHLELTPEEFGRWRTLVPERPGEVSEIVEERDAFVLLVALEANSRGIRAARQAVPKITWDQWWAGVEGEFRETNLPPVASRTKRLPPPGARGRIARRPVDSSPQPDAAGAAVMSSPSCVPDDTWDNGILDDLPAWRSGHTLVWTGSLMLIWGGAGQVSFLNDGVRYNPVLDTFTPMSVVDAPQAREAHTAVWTGSELVVWGGADDCCSPPLATGGRYDPVSDTWAPTSSIGALGRVGHTAVWTGSEMIVWGGYAACPVCGISNGGGRYDPASDTWAATSTAGAPTRRTHHTSVWTGSRMIVWGGWDDQNQQTNTGGLYDPTTNTWTPVSLTSAPQARRSHSAVWSGMEMIVWGGRNDSSRIDLATGGRYDPASNSWVATATVGAPQERHSHAAVWTGSEMIIWGGEASGDPFDLSLDSGGRYNPTSDTWTPTSLTNAPSPRAAPAVWTGSLMIVWSGNTGGRYDPATDAWTPTSTLNAPSPTGDVPGAVWTGTVMIVWTATGSTPGSRYDPLTDSWTPTSTLNAPQVRRLHTAVWTGEAMIVWGGINISGPIEFFGTGGRYDPVSDTWQPTSTTDAPQGRARHTAVWSGSEMIVWGGSRNFDTALNTGGRYNPLTDSWIPTSTFGAPAPRMFHTAVWTGEEMIIWGGATPFVGDHGTGGRYDPLRDTWRPTSTTNAPSPRSDHTATWTGREMIVWAGWGSGYLSTGARYEPRTDTWLPTSGSNAPEGRYVHTATWTGREMIVWGGAAARGWVNTGGRYDPATDTWAPTSTIGAPFFSSAPTAVWTGSFMVVWAMNWGGRYALGHSEDNDSDGFSECAGDCNDANSQVWFPPTEVSNLTVTNAAGTLVSWDSQGAIVGPETQYDLASGAIDAVGGVDFLSSTCLVAGAPTSFLDARPDPPSGSGVWYLVRGRNACGLGTYGTPQRDQGIPVCP